MCARRRSPWSSAHELHKKPPVVPLCSGARLSLASSPNRLLLHSVIWAHTHNVGVTRAKLSLNSRAARIILFSMPLSSPSYRSATAPVDTARQGRASAHDIRSAATLSRGHGDGQPHPPVSCLWWIYLCWLCFYSVYFDLYYVNDSSL
jgi:hypothetical protein